MMDALIGRDRARIGFLTAAVLIVTASGAAAESALRANTVQLGVSVGASVSHDLNAFESTESITGLQFLAHIGWVVTDEVGPGWLRGNLQLLAEPALIHLESDRSSTTIGGISALARWLFVGTGRVRPYVEVGAGVVAGPMDFRQTNCDVNFILAAGPGIMVLLSDSTALSIGYRLQHISNASLCFPNVGINSSLFLVGVSYFFP